MVSTVVYLIAILMRTYVVAVPLAPPASVGCRDRTRAPGRLEPALTIIPEDRTAGMPLKLRISTYWPSSQVYMSYHLCREAVYGQS